MTDSDGLNSAYQVAVPSVWKIVVSNCGSQDLYFNSLKMTCDGVAGGSASYYHKLDLTHIVSVTSTPFRTETLSLSASPTQFLTTSSVTMRYKDVTKIIKDNMGVILTQ